VKHVRELNTVRPEDVTVPAGYGSRRNTCSWGSGQEWLILSPAETHRLIASKMDTETRKRKSRFCYSTGLLIPLHVTYGGAQQSVHPTASCISFRIFCPHSHDVPRDLRMCYSMN